MCDPRVHTHRVCMLFVCAYLFVYRCLHFPTVRRVYRCLHFPTVVFRFVLVYSRGHRTFTLAVCHDGSVALNADAQYL